MTRFRPFDTRAMRGLRVFAATGALALVASQALAQAIFLTAPQEVSRINRPPISIDPAPVNTTPARPPQYAAPAPAQPPVQAQAPQLPAAPARTPALQFPAPAAPGAAQPPAPGSGPLAAAGPRPTLKARPTMLRHLANNIQGYRLAGEIGSSEWPMYITDKQARRRLQFQLGYLSAVSVMPEFSRLILSINDQPVGATPITAMQTVKTVVFDIPPGLLRPGFNSVRITTEQRHRVDCSLEATQELWTQIDPTQTGLILDEADAAIDAISDLGALPADEQGALPLRAVLHANPTTRDIERMLRVVQLISIIGRFEQPVVDAGALAGGRYGANLLVGTAAELAAIAGPQMVGVVTKPRAFVLPATPERRTTIVVTGADAQQVDEAIKQFLVATKPKGAAAGLRAAAAFPGYRVEGGQRLRLADLGVRSAEFDGRLFRTAFNIIMPSDFYPADYGRATVRVAGGYSPGLTSKAQLVMYVNERTAVSLPLLKSTGEVFKDNPLPVPLGFLRPGLNRIEIEAHVPTPSDESCDTLAAKDAPNRFLFLDATEIEIPLIARVGRLPDLAVTATGGFPFAGAQRRSKLYMPRIDPKTIGAAATFVAHLAVVAGRPIDFEITQTPPLKAKSPTLAVAPYDALDPDLLKKLDMPVDDLSRVWREKIGVESRGGTEIDDNAVAVDAPTRNRLVLQNNFPMACHPPRSLGGFRAMLRNIDRFAVGATEEDDSAEDAPPASVGEEEEASSDLFQEWDARLRNENRLSWLIDFMRGVGEWGKAKFTDAGDLFRGFERGASPSEMSPETSLALGQNILGGANENVWTVLTAPNADALADSVACLVDPRVSRQIAGQVSLLDISKAKIDAIPVSNTHFVITQPLSVGNARLIAAGWLSLHSRYYVGAALLIGFLLALTTRVFVKNVGRRTP
ncbi:cellulose biosynthesis cyclic di-GMP-binding regulatory protein BcsB [Methylocystis sp. JAN1]|uniref:cellulose biosynthesis cyclic di-GMP-binding regulatory protein BcsB n=1 Tax=Methylocystis sp. JAN1 TaxID=3397211 RepID=UPI003FA2D27F